MNCSVPSSSLHFDKARCKVLVMTPLYRSIIRLLLTLLCLVELGIAADFYVDGAVGNDGNAGTMFAAFRTINHGASVLQPGDVLYVRRGLYAESLINAIPSGTSWSAPVVVAAYPGERVTLQPPRGTDRVLHFDGVQTQYIQVEGFVLDGVNVTHDVVKITYNDNEANYAHHIRIKNCEVKNSRENQGLLITGGNAFVELIGLDVHDNGNSELHHGIYLSASDSTIEGCRVHNNAGYGIHLYGGRGDVNRNLVWSNQVYDNGRATDKAGIIVSAGDSNTVEHNLVYGHKYGINVDYNVSNTKLDDNTVYGRDFMTGGIYIGTTSTGAVVTNNLVFQTYPGSEIIDLGLDTTLSNNLEGVDPGWVNLLLEDVQVQSDSPAIDTSVVDGRQQEADEPGFPRYRSKPTSTSEEAEWVR